MVASRVDSPRLPDRFACWRLDQGLVGVAPQPVLTRLHGADDLVGGGELVGVAAGVLVLGGVTAQHLPVGHAHPQMHPAVPQLQAGLATGRGRRDLADLVQMATRSWRALADSLPCEAEIGEHSHGGSSSSEAGLHRHGSRRASPRYAPLSQLRRSVAGGRIRLGWSRSRGPTPSRTSSRSSGPSRPPCSTRPPPARTYSACSRRLSGWTAAGASSSAAIGRLASQSASVPAWRFGLALQAVRPRPNESSE